MAIGTVITDSFAQAGVNFGIAAAGIVTAVSVLTGVVMIIALMRK